mmetsp:Transcript_31091/g.81450  ORF Transcript_31091/g.81450 Transcript_31091/m.81450 type:complete len:203 (+) Transcript_31091:973-1581(+)
MARGPVQQRPVQLSGQVGQRHVSPAAHALDGQPLPARASSAAWPVARRQPWLPPPPLPLLALSRDVVPQRETPRFCGFRRRGAQPPAPWPRVPPSRAVCARQQLPPSRPPCLQPPSPLFARWPGAPPRTALHPRSSRGGAASSPQAPSHHHLMMQPLAWPANWVTGWPTAKLQPTRVETNPPPQSLRLQRSLQQRSTWPCQR